MPTTITLQPENPDLARLEPAVDALRAGKLVAFPGDGSYLVASQSKECLRQKAAELRRENDVVWLLRAFESVSQWTFPPRARRLMHRFWPGPLTLLLPNAEGKEEAIHCPRNPVAAYLLERIGAPLLAAQVSLAEIEGGSAEVVVEAGPPRWKLPPTLVRPGPRSMQVVRSGAIPEALIRELDYTQVLFVCTGNTCRSPMAAATLQHLLGQAGAANIRIVSAGTGASRGGEMSDLARETLQAMGIPAGRHESRSLDRHLVEDSDRIFVMTGGHRDYIVSRWPGEAARVERLDPRGMDIEDPIGGGPEDYRRAFRRIRDSLAARIEELAPPAPAVVEKKIIALGADHAGYRVKEAVKEWASGAGWEILDLGTDSGEPVDYPEFARKVALAVAEGRARRGFLCCGTGIGMSMAANRIPGVRAALVANRYMAEMSRRHNDANVMCVGARVLALETILDLLKVWLETPFEGGRHERRVKEIDAGAGLVRKDSERL